MDYKDVTKEIVNYFEKGTLKIIKVDENEVPLEGIKFEIYNSNKELVDTIVTDKNGVAQSKPLVLGKYYYKEVEAPDNIVIDDDVFTFLKREKKWFLENGVVVYYKRKKDNKIFGIRGGANNSEQDVEFIFSSNRNWYLIECSKDFEI